MSLEYARFLPTCAHVQAIAFTRGACALSFAATLLWASPSRSSSDSTSFRIEAGAVSDVSNEQFYEETYSDTVFLGRRLSSAPEYRNASVFLVDYAGASASRRLDYRLLDELTIGDHLLRSWSRASLQASPRPGLKLIFDPEIEMRRDLSFGSTRRQARARVDGRVREALGDGSDALELAATGDWFRTSGASELLLLDRNAGQGRVRWTHAPLYGQEWELGVGADVRAFPDSIERDHVEQHFDASTRRDLLGVVSWSLVGGLDRRTTLHPAASTADRFWNGRGELSSRVRWNPSLATEASAEVEGFRYDRPDSVVYFDYELWRARLAMRAEHADGWSVSIGPRFEWLRCRAVPAERYREVAGALDFDRLSGTAWWSVTPIAGWRQYENAAARLGAGQELLHSSYLFAELQLLGDQPAPGRVRVRALATIRAERHEDPSQDARSLYFSLDVRRLF